MFDWNDLRYFLAVARAGSTLAAAKALGVNQSTVHRRLQEFERQLGCQLVQRRPTGYRLTELGEALRAQAERVEEAVADFARGLAATSQELKGTVKVTCPEALGPRLIDAGVIQKFNQRFPAVRVEFVMSDRILDLAAGEADVALRTTTPVENALVGRKIAESPWAVYASRAYMKRRGSIGAAEDIGRHDVVMFAGILKDHHAARWLRTVAPGAHVAARADSVPTLLMAVKSGAGLAPMPVVVAEREKDLVRVLDLGPDLATPIYLVMHEDMRRTPRVRAFFDFVIEHLRDIRPLLGQGSERPATKPARGKAARR